MFIYEKSIDTIRNDCQITSLIEFFAPNFGIFLTSCDTDCTIDDKQYRSGYILNSVKIENLEDIENNKISIFDKYEGEYVEIERLLESSVIIKMLIEDKMTIVFSGFVSKIDIEDHVLNISIVSKLAKLNASIGKLFSPICRECLESSKCGVKLEQYKSFGKVVSIISADCFVGDDQINNKTPVGYYKYGIIKLLTGKLRGVSLQIEDEIDDKIYLLQNTRMLSIGDKYEIFAGCDKTLSTCRSKFNNVINFRGEPYIN